MSVQVAKLFAVYLHLLTFDISLSAPAKSAISCGLTKLNAVDQPRVFTSPKYPGYFAEQTQCTWLIEAPQGKRVKLIIKDFALVNDPSCFSQHVMFTDDFTGHQYGPLCSRRPQEDIISGGRTLRVKLESDTANSKRYRGFKILYTSTSEMTSDTMKDPAGKWQRYTQPKATLSSSPSPTDRIVDVNGNAAINQQNQIENQKNSKLSDQRSAENFTPIIETRRQRTQKPAKPTPTTIPGRWSPSKRTKMKRPTISRTRRPPSRPYYPRPRGVGGAEAKENDVAFTALKYVGIVLALMVVLIVVFVIYYKMRQKARKKDKENNSSFLSSMSSKIFTTPSAEFQKTYYDNKTALEEISLSVINHSGKQKLDTKATPVENDCYVKIADADQTTDVPSKSKRKQGSSNRHIRPDKQEKQAVNGHREREPKMNAKRKRHRSENKKDSKEIVNPEIGDKSHRRRKQNNESTERRKKRESGQHDVTGEKCANRRHLEKKSKSRKPERTVSEQERRRKRKRKRKHPTTKENEVS